jgi:phosphate:Na+ symporter
LCATFSRSTLQLADEQHEREADGMTFELAARLLGGIGLFLLGMHLMTEGLKVAAGRALREVLARSTRTRLRGVASGFLVTSLVQSSSAITVATIGFVNAGLLTLSQALAVTYGSNIGTTTTGWLVAAVGFHIDIKAFALPLIGIGMALRVVFRTGRLGPLGEALAGFGIFFLGIETLRTVFDGLSGHIEIEALSGGGPLRVLLFVAIGFALTVLMQSSSAAIAIILTAAGGGVIPLGSGAALVVGANVGTTSTAAFAVIGATPNAKRVAAGHVVFNLIAGAVALALLPLMLLLIVQGRELMHLENEPAAVLAGFHTIFNLLGVALLWPLTNVLLRYLEGRFRTAEEDEATPRYLDRHVVRSPDLALNAIVLELARVGQIAQRLVRAALGHEDRAHGTIAAGQRSLAALVDAVGDFAQLLQRASLPQELVPLLPDALSVARRYSEAAELAGMIASERTALARLEGRGADDPLGSFIAEALALVQHAGLAEPEYSAEVADRNLSALQDHYKALRASMLDVGSKGRHSIRDVVESLDCLSNVRRSAEQITWGTRELATLHSATTTETPPGSDSRDSES